MRVLIAGAAGALGMQVTRRLVAAGHVVWGLTRSPANRDKVAKGGAEPLIVDALDLGALQDAIGKVAPQAVIHALTALPRGGPIRASQLRATTTLRIKGTANLIDASIRAGTARIVAESNVGIYGFGDLGPDLISEADSPKTPRVSREVLAAVEGVGCKYDVEFESQPSRVVCGRMGTFAHGQP